MVYREDSIVYRPGTYSAKIVAGAAGGYLFTQSNIRGRAQYLRSFLAATADFTVRVYASSASKVCPYLQTDTGVIWGGWNATSTWEELNARGVVDATSTYLTYGIYVSPGETAYVCLPTLRPYLGAYQGFAMPSPETIWLEKPYQILAGYALPLVGATTTVTYGNIIPPGIKTIHGIMTATNSVAGGKYIDIISGDGSYLQIGRVQSQVAGQAVSTMFSGPVNYNDTISYVTDDANWTINYVRIIGVEV